MSGSADGTFTIDSWDEETDEAGAGATLARARVTKTFTGDLAGTSTTDLLLCRTQVDTSAAYVGFERFTGVLAGRSGTFVLHHSATSDASGATLTWSVVPDSGTGDLRHPRGQGQITVDAGGGHAYTLDYDLAGPRKQ